MTNKKTSGRRNKAAGHKWELEVIRLLKEFNLYDAEVVTCRSNNRRLDGLGIDLMYFNEAAFGMMRDSIQTKTSVRPPAFPSLLDRIRKALRPGAVVFWRQTSSSREGKQMERDRFAMAYMDRYLYLMACEKFVINVRRLIKCDRGGHNGVPDGIWIAALEDELENLKL